MQTILHFLPQGGTAQGTLGGLVQGTAVIDALQAQAVDHVLVDGLGEGVGALEHHAHLTAKGGDIHALVIDVVAVQLDLPLDAADLHQIVHPVDAAQQSGLAATGRADEGGDLTLGDLHVDVEQRLLVAVVQVEILHLQRSLLRGQVEQVGGGVRGRTRCYVDHLFTSNSLGGSGQTSCPLPEYLVGREGPCPSL